MPPPEGATGIRFPYQAPRRLVQVQNPTAKANGFSSMGAMLIAHNMVLEALAQSPPKGLTVDLGCGTGHLMRRIKEKFHVPVAGVESDATKVQGNTDILIANLAAMDSLPQNADTLVVSQRRFEEIPLLEEWARKHSRQVLVYSYDVTPDQSMFAAVQRGTT